MEVAITDMLQTYVDWVRRAFEAPSARAHVFGVQIGGMLPFSLHPYADICSFLLQIY